MPSDGRWRLVIFAGDVREPTQMAKLHALADFLLSDDGPVALYTPADADTDARFDPIVIIAGGRNEVEHHDFPELFRPIRTSTGYRDYGKIYSDEPTLHEGDSKAYERYGISKQAGCVVVARPDQHVALVCPLEDHKTLAAYFAGFSKPSPGKPVLGKYSFPSRPVTKANGVHAANGVTEGTGAL